MSKVRAETDNKISEVGNKMNLAEKEANYKIAAIENEGIILRQAAHSKATICTSFP